MLFRSQFQLLFTKLTKLSIILRMDGCMLLKQEQVAEAISEKDCLYFHSKVVERINKMQFKKSQDNDVEDLQTQCFPETSHCSTSTMVNLVVT